MNGMINSLHDTSETYLKPSIKFASKIVVMEYGKCGTLEDEI